MGAECDPRFTSTIFHYLYVEKQNAILLSALTCVATLLATSKFGLLFAGEPRNGWERSQIGLRCSGAVPDYFLRNPHVKTVWELQPLPAFFRCLGQKSYV